MKKYQKNPRFSFFFIIFLLLITFLVPLAHNHVVQAIDPEPNYEQIDRFGITLIADRTPNYKELVTQINVKAVLDWKQDDKNEWSEYGIDYLHVIRVNDTSYNNGEILNNLPNLLEENKGEVWIIGNEPDRDIQDGVTPEVYAKRFYEIAIRIRYHDPSAKIGFGSVVQPTPIRIRYLERAINHLTYLSCGNRQAAMDLIDIWSIHAFILNEHPLLWGAGIPVGLYDPDNYNSQDWYDAIRITNFADTYSIDIFNQRIIHFRNWMNSIGEKEKPLWITEYGSLFPDWEIICLENEYADCDNPQNGWPTETDTNQYMIDTFNLLLTKSDPNIGFFEDQNRLIQRWFWYSLNDYRDQYGGSLFDPNQNYLPTLAGESFTTYTDGILANSLGSEPVLFTSNLPQYQLVYYDETSNQYNYPYEICSRSFLPLVRK